MTGPDHFGSSGIAAQIVVLVAQSGSERCSSQVRALLEQGFKVLTAADGPEILTLLGSKALDCVVTDAALPQLNGIELLGRMHELDPDLPVVLVTDHPTVDCAAKAVEYGAFRYLGGSVTLEQLVEVVRLAAQVCRVSRLRRQAFVHVRHAELPTEGRASLEAHFERTLAGLWMGFQPVVHWPARRIVAYEALLRSEDGVHADPETLLDVAARLGRLPDVGRAIRSAVADTVRSTAEPFDFFVNLHSRDLLDANLFLSSEPLSTVAERVVLEITERASLEQISGVRDRIGRLRALGYRIAVDDLGAGYAGLTSFAQLQPDVVKLDMVLVRDIHLEPTKRRLVEAIVRASRDMAVEVVAEAVESEAERDVLCEAGCELLQGYLFGPPARGLTDAAGCARGSPPSASRPGVRKAQLPVEPPALDRGTRGTQPAGFRRAADPLKTGRS